VTGKANQLLGDVAADALVTEIADENDSEVFGDACLSFHSRKLNRLERGIKGDFPAERF
jgi:hypothetical protein